MNFMLENCVRWVGLGKSRLTSTVAAGIQPKPCSKTDCTRLPLLNSTVRDVCSFNRNTASMVYSLCVVKGSLCSFLRSTKILTF